MKRLLKIKEFFHLKKRDADSPSSNSRPGTAVFDAGTRQELDCRMFSLLSSHHCSHPSLYLYYPYRLLAFQTPLIFVAIPFPVKRSRLALKGDTPAKVPCAQAEESITMGAHDQFLKLFESEMAKDIVWWLPGRRGEAFAMHQKRFEQELMKIHFREIDLADFAKQLNLWYVLALDWNNLLGVPFSDSPHHHSSIYVQ